MARATPELIERMTAWRRHLHTHPELATHEQETSDFVCAELTRLGIPFERGIGGHGIVATLHRPGSPRSVGLRADMDALPITEKTGKPWSSQVTGRMHACGHDGHTASLLGAAHLLTQDPSWSGTIRLIFQPAEEGGIGAKAMIADGFFERFPLDAIYAYHNWPGVAAGTIALRPGGLMAAGGRIAIRLTGRPCHAAMPQEGRDSLLAAAHLITALQSVPSRAVAPTDPVVVSVTTLRTGEAFNQISDEVVLGGTIRTLSNEVRDLVETEITRIVHGIAATFNIEAEVSLRRSAPVTWNSPSGVADALQAAGRAGFATISDITPSMAGEDFAWFLERIPGAMVWIGNGEMVPGGQLHSPEYDFNDDILPVAASWLHEVACASLRRND